MWSHMCHICEYGVCVQEATSGQKKAAHACPPE